MKHTPFFSLCFLPLLSSRFTHSSLHWKKAKLNKQRAFFNPSIQLLLTHGRTSWNLEPLIILLFLISFLIRWFCSRFAYAAIETKPTNDSLHIPLLLSGGKRSFGISKSCFRSQKHKLNTHHSFLRSLFLFVFCSLLCSISLRSCFVSFIKITHFVPHLYFNKTKHFTLIIS